jgi:hypothetical protein
VTGRGLAVTSVGEGFVHPSYTLAYIYIVLMVAVLAPAAAVVWVASDALAIRRLEVLSCGESDCRPYRWAAAVFLLPVVAIPMYVKYRNRRTEQLDILAATSYASD